MTDFRIPGLEYSSNNHGTPALKETAYSHGETDSEGMLLSLGLNVPSNGDKYDGEQAKKQTQTSQGQPVTPKAAATETPEPNDLDTLRTFQETMMPSTVAMALESCSGSTLTGVEHTDSMTMVSHPDSRNQSTTPSIGQSETRRQDDLAARTNNEELKIVLQAEISTNNMNIESALSALKDLDDKESSQDQVIPIVEPEPEDNDVNDKTNASMPKLNGDDAVRSEGITAQETRTTTEPTLSDGTHQPTSLTAPPHRNPVTPHSPAPEAEFAYDSSPYTSSTNHSDTSSSYDDSDDSAEDYELLDPAEQARLLMAEDGGGSDGEGGGSGKAAGPPKTQNEKPEVIVPKPDVVVTLEMPITLLGQVENVVENLSLIKATVSGEYQVLEAGSLLCLEDRTVVGVIAETLGRVQQPFYSVAFTNATEMAEVAMNKPGTKVFCIPQFAKTVFTQAIKGIKGSDASNIHDEEVDADEMEFSDDEKEAEYRRSIKQKKEARKRERNGLPPPPSRNGDFQGGDRKGNNRKRQFEQGDSGQQHRNSHDANQMGADTELKYEDDDGLYTPLARPSNLHEVVHAPPPVQSYPPAGYSRPPRGGRGGRGRGRGGRDGHFGGGRGGGAHSLPPRPPISNGQGYNTQNQNKFPQQLNTSSPPFQQQQPQNTNYPISNSMLPPPPPMQDFPHPTSHYQSNHGLQYPQPSPQTYQNHFNGGYQDQSQQHPQSGYHQSYGGMQSQYNLPTNQPQFPSYAPQEQHRQQQQQQRMQQQPPPGIPNIPPGAFINPAFFRPPG